MERLAMTLKNLLSLFALALFVSPYQACKSWTTKSDSNAAPATQNQTSPANETVVPAPPTFREDFVGTIGNKYDISMSLERKSADLTGSYFYERAGAFNVYESEKKTLKLKGLIRSEEHT